MGEKNDEVAKWFDEKVEKVEKVAERYVYLQIKYLVCYNIIVFVLYFSCTYVI